MDEYSPKAPYSKIKKKRQEKLNLSGNFTRQHKQFEVTFPVSRESMRQNILEAVTKRTETMLSDERNTVYEDPRDVLDKPPSKPPRKRTVQGIAMSSPRSGKEHKSLLKDQKRKLTKKYESLITTLMDRCEENIVTIKEKDSYITKLKDKLKTVLEYNKLFAEENDTLRSQYQTVVKYVEECKIVMKQQRELNRDLEERKAEMEERVKKFEVPDRDHCQSAIPLVEVCMSCSSRQIVLNQAREHNIRLQKDMQALKDVLYRLNVQLSRYQEKLKSCQPQGNEDIFKPSDRDRYDTLDSLITASIGCKTDGATDDGQTHKQHEESTRLVDLSGLLSAQALAPLFDAYQDNLQEKDNLILDYEKQFEIMNKKSKEIVLENKTLSERVKNLEDELVRLRQSYKKMCCEKETGDIERATLLERAERAESKLKEVYELYEDKMAAMMRDYETVHREYYNLKGALDVSTSERAQLTALRATTVPADLHERRLQHCTRLLEELKHQYNMENERKNEQVAKLNEQIKQIQDKYEALTKDNQVLKDELEAALKNVRLYRKAAVIFRQRVKAASARLRTRTARAPRALTHALQALDTIKQEIKSVKSRAYTSLEELERRIVLQERRAAAAHREYTRELERARLALARKEDIIRSLIDKVADVEEVRLSQTNSHRLQGIVDSPDLSPRDVQEAHVKVTEVHQDKDGKKKPKS